MPITIAHHPIAAPIAGAYATGVARGAERRRQEHRESLERWRNRMFQRQERLAGQNFRAGLFGAKQEHDKNMAEWEAEQRESREEKRFQQNRKAEEHGALLDEIRAREEMMGGLPLSETGREKWKGLQKELSEARRKEMKGEYRVGAMMQVYNDWIDKFDSEGWDSLVEEPPTADERLSGGVVMTEKGPMSWEDFQGSGLKHGKILIPGEDGKWESEEFDFREEAAESSFEQDNYRDAYSAAREQLMEEASLAKPKKDKDGNLLPPEPPKREDILERSRQILSDWRSIGGFETPGDGPPPMPPPDFQPEEGSPSLGVAPQAPAPSSPAMSEDQFLGGSDVSGAAAGILEDYGAAPGGSSEETGRVARLREMVGNVEEGSDDWAALAIDLIKAKYGTNAGPHDILDPKDRFMLEKALQVALNASG